jgi:hypothetical protein
VPAPWAVPTAPLLGCRLGTSISGFRAAAQSNRWAAMNRLAIPVALALSLSYWPAPAHGKADPLCAPLRKFLASVKPDETREIVFRTSWGGGFKDDPSTNDSIASRRCEHQNYAPAKRVCDVLIANSSVEFGNVNAIGAVVCISPDIRFPRYIEFDHGSLSLNYGTPNRGANVSLSYEEDSEVGGMKLHIVADGY